MSDPRHVILLGAGASVDAGLSTSVQMAQQIYDDISSTRASSSYAKILAYVISKLQTRNAKKGLSPYQPIEVEELFDALNLLYKKDSLLISEFVERWDEAIDSHYSVFDHNAIKSNIDNIISAHLRSTNGRQLFSSVSDADYQNLAKSLQPKSSFSQNQNRRRVPDPQQPFFNSLIRHLSVDEGRLSYLYPLVKSASVSIIATLNYDLSIEMACSQSGVQYDYGLDRWVQQKRVEWVKGNATRLLKLHGSINWTGDPENLVVRADDIKSHEKRAMIFGGVENKLSADGPFLQFLYRLERSLLATGSAVIIGYSFRDPHINALLRRWRLTRRVTKMLVIDPSPPPLWQIGFGDGVTTRKVGDREVKYTANVRVMNCNAAEGIQRFFNEPDIFDQPIENPHLLVRRLPIKPGGGTK